MTENSIIILPNPEASVSKKVKSRSSKPVYVICFLGTIFVIVLTFITLFITRPELFAIFGNSLQQEQSKEDDVEYLVDTEKKIEGVDQAVILTPWIVALIASFIALQMIPVIVAAIKTRKKNLTEQIEKEIAFLCETPMYLGLLGSLMGVCLTQFITGSLSAPLAYLTTISGISLHLVARFAIIVPLPGKSAFNTIEEV